MSDEAAITIKGQRLSDDESAVLRVAVEAFTIVMAQGIDDNDEGITCESRGSPRCASKFREITCCESQIPQAPDRFRFQHRPGDQILKIMHTRWVHVAESVSELPNPNW
jgi:hypothetical protein